MKTGGCGCTARPRAREAVEVIADRAGLDRALSALDARRDAVVRAVLGLPARPPKRSRAAVRRWRAALPSRLRTRARRGPPPVKEKGTEATELGAEHEVARCGCNGISPASSTRQLDEQKYKLPQNRVPQGGPDRNNPGGGLDWRYQPSERFAINNPYLFVVEDRGGAYQKYGAMEDILQDIEDLGAGVVRQPHRLQLFLERFVRAGFSAPSGAFSEVDTRRAEEAIGEAVVASDLLGPSGRLEQVVFHLHDTGSSLKLLLTFLTLGGGRETSTLTYGPYSNPLEFPWPETTHSGHWITDDFGETYRFSTRSGDWATDTLEPRSGYKRTFYRMLARRVARRLNFMRSLWLREYDLDLQDYLLGVEIGNELEQRHTVEIGGRVWGDADAWGDLWFECATAMRDEANWLPIWLPGVSSYTGADDIEDMFRTWEGKSRFLEYLLRRIQTRLDEPLYRGVYSISDLVAGLDYHYYHRSEGDAQRLAYLVADLLELRGLLNGAGLQNALLTVMESGVNVACASPSDATATRFFASYDQRCEYTDSTFPYPDFTQPTPDPSSTEPGDLNTPSVRPELARCDGGTHVETSAGDREQGALTFQAMSVWMRLAVALAGGADIVGWHTFMSDNGMAVMDGEDEESQFAAMGLRRDQHDRDVAPSAAQQRASWFAYQRMTQFLGTVGTATVLLPDPDKVEVDHEVLDTTIETDWDLLDDVWCIELELSSPLHARWAYLLFLDPYGDARCAMVYLRVVSAAEGTLIRVVQVPTGPREFTADPTVATEFPEDSWSEEDATEVVSGPAERLALVIDLAKGAWPVLLLSTEALTPFRLFTGDTTP